MSWMMWAALGLYLGGFTTYMILIWRLKKEWKELDELFGKTKQAWEKHEKIVELGQKGGYRDSAILFVATCIEAENNLYGEKPVTKYAKIASIMDIYLSRMMDIAVKDVLLINRLEGLINQVNAGTEGQPDTKILNAMLESAYKQINGKEPTIDL